MNIDWLVFNSVWSVMRFAVIALSLYFVFRTCRHWFYAYREHQINKSRTVEAGGSVFNAATNLEIKKGFINFWVVVAIQILLVVIPAKFTSGVEEVHKQLDAKKEQQREERRQDVKTLEQLANEQIERERREQEEIQNDLKRRVDEQTKQSNHLYNEFTGEK